MLTQKQALEALTHLGLSSDDFARVRREPTLEKARSLLADVKVRAKKGYRRAAFELHPDRNANDSAKTELFKLVKDAYEAIVRLRVQRRSPAVFVPMINISMGGWSSNATTTTTTTSGGYGFGAVHIYVTR